MKTIRIKIVERPLRKGHQAHRSGSGVMQDARTKRERTRSSRVKKHIGEW